MNQDLSQLALIKAEKLIEYLTIRQCLNEELDYLQNEMDQCSEDDCTLCPYKDQCKLYIKYKFQKQNK